MKNETVEIEVIKEVAIRQETVPAAITPMTLIEKALTSDVSMEKLQQLFDLQIQWEKNEAKKAFHKAISAFKTESILILKDKRVGYTNKDGTFTGYSHATLGGIVSTITPIMSKHELSHTWDINQDAGQITVTCTLSHSLGHSESVSMSAGKDDSGKKNMIQQVASTITYLQRYTLLAITGLAASDQDDDGKKGSVKEDIEYITERQIDDLGALIAEVNANEAGFLKWFKVNNLEDLPKAKFEEAVKMLEAKRGK